MGKKGKGKKGRTRKNNVSYKHTEPEELRRAPHTFVVARGRTGRYVNQLVLNFRHVMEPFTASSLQMKKPTIRHLSSVAGLLGVTHCCMFSHTQLSTYMKIGRFPRGPTLTFRVEHYTLARDVLAVLRRRVTYAKQFAHAPLLILNNFSGPQLPQHVQLVATTLQNMFPTLNVHKVKLRHLRRAVLFSYNPDDETIEFRHYTVKLTPTGVNRAVRKLVTSNRVPNMSRLQSISEYIARSGCASDSEAEDELGAANTVELAQPVGSRGNNIPHAQSAVKLIELGPRITLTLVKAQAELMEGDILYHRFHEKSEQEVKELKEKRKAKENVKIARRQQQEANIRGKEEAKLKHREKCNAVEATPDTNEAANGETDDSPGAPKPVQHTVTSKRSSSSKFASGTKRRAVIGSKIKKKTTVT